MNKIDEQFIKEKVNPVVGFIYHTARQLGEDHAPNSMDMEYLKQGTEKVCELLREASPTAPPALEDAKAFEATNEQYDEWQDWALDWIWKAKRSKVEIDRDGLAQEIASKFEDVIDTVIRVESEQYADKRLEAERERIVELENALTSILNSPPDQCKWIAQRAMQAVKARGGKE